MKIRGYTIYAVITTVLQEVALFVVVLWVLPEFGISIPTLGLVLMMVILGVYACTAYVLGIRALRKKPLITPGVGGKGKTVTSLTPVGYVRVRGELWRASSDSNVDAGEEVDIVGIEDMTLLVTPSRELIQDAGKMNKFNI